VSAAGAGFDGLSGATETTTRTAPPDGVRTIAVESADATRIVLVRHGEARCNVSGVCGGPRGCGGLTDVGREQVAALGDRLAASGELFETSAFYASVLPRAIETATGIAGALAAAGTGPTLVTECGLCELHPGEADAMSWDEFSAAFGSPDWDSDPSQPIAPGGESWTGFVRRVAATLDELAARHPGELVVVATHAGVVEASLLAKVPVAGGLDGARLKLRTAHTSLTTWEVDAGQWRLLSYNDATHLRGGARAAGAGAPRPAAQQA
jgi:broad specificity phosphatase PhoE